MAAPKSSNAGLDTDGGPEPSNAGLDTGGKVRAHRGKPVAAPKPSNTGLDTGGQVREHRGKPVAVPKPPTQGPRRGILTSFFATPPRTSQTVVGAGW